MRIHTDHLYHGAALIQIAEDGRVNAINAMWLDGSRLRSAFRINEAIGIRLKYATKPSHGEFEYSFTFTREERGDLAKLAGAMERAFVVLVCVQAAEICCLRYEDVCELFDRRRVTKGAEEEQYMISVVVAPGKRLRACIKAPGRRGLVLGEPMLVDRREFPRGLFERQQDDGCSPKV